jgi:glycoside hydrolase-like protein
VRAVRADLSDLAVAVDAVTGLDTDAETAIKFGMHHAPALSRNGVPGVDFAWSKPSIGSLSSAGEMFVAQYASLDPTKNLTPARAQALLASKISIVLVYEYDAQDMLRGNSGGVADAQNAETLARACGIDGIPIYFAADWDATPSQQSLINDYLDGCAAVLGIDRVGIYGGYWPTSRAKAAGKCTYVWGTPAWSGTNWSTGFTPDIMQGGFVTIGGVQCDLDAGLRADYGQWPRPANGSFNWGWWVTDGNESLAAVSRRLTARGVPDMSPAHILRATCMKLGGHWDNQMFSWLNFVLGDPVQDPHTPISAGSRLWVLQ